MHATDGFDGDAKSLTDDLPVCHSTGSGFAINLIYKEDGTRQKEHKQYERSFHCQQIDSKTCLYAICTGQNGPEVAEFAIQKITAEILFGQLNNCSPSEVKEVLKQAIIAAEKDYLDSINEFLAQKTELQCLIPENVRQCDVIKSNNYEEILSRLIQIDKNLTVGTSVILALIFDSQLYVCNLGNCRALMCKTDENDALSVHQLSVDHNIFNESERKRLAELGIDTQSMQQGSFECTRCIGCYSSKAGYKDSLYLSGATSEPVISDPEIIGPISLDDSCRFLVLMSGGMCKTLHDIFPGKPNDINRSIIQTIVEQFRSQSTIAGVAQSSVYRIVQMHHDTYMRQAEQCKFHARDDVTLLVRNFNFPMPNALKSQRFDPVSHVDSTLTSSTSTFIDTNSSIQTNSPTSSNGPIDTIDKNKKIKPYVDFTNYYKLVAEAKARNELDTTIQFD